MKNLRYFLIALSLTLLAPQAAKAAAITIDDTSPNNTITISVNDFEYGFFVNGTLFQQGLNNGQSITLTENLPVSFSGQWIDLGESIPVNKTIYFVKPDTPTLISKIFNYSVSTDGSVGTILGTFQSDLAGNLGSLPLGVDPANVFIENGQSVPFSAAYLGGRILSDTPETVPEPTSTLGFLALGTLGAASNLKHKLKPAKSSDKETTKVS